MIYFQCKDAAGLVNSTRESSFTLSFRFMHTLNRSHYIFCSHEIYPFDSKWECSDLKRKKATFSIPPLLLSQRHKGSVSNTAVADSLATVQIKTNCQNPSLT